MGETPTSQKKNHSMQGLCKKLKSELLEVKQRYKREGVRRYLAIREIQASFVLCFVG